MGGAAGMGALAGEWAVCSRMVEAGEEAAGWEAGRWMGGGEWRGAAGMGGSGRWRMAGEPRRKIFERKVSVHCHHVAHGAVSRIRHDGRWVALGTVRRRYSSRCGRSGTDLCWIWTTPAQTQGYWDYCTRRSDADASHTVLIVECKVTDQGGRGL